MRRAVIFDFDGTLADSMKVVIAIFHELTGGKYESRTKDVEAFRSKQPHQVVRDLGIRWWQIPSLLTKGRKAMHSRMSEVQPFPGVAQAIEQLEADGYQLYILSSNSAVNIRQFLQAHKLEKYFQEVQGGAAIFGKITAIKRIMATQHIKSNECVYVGDEVRDVLAAKRVGIPALAVAWGYNSKSALQHSHPDAIAENAKELVRAIEELQAV